MQALSLLSTHAALELKQAKAALAACQHDLQFYRMRTRYFGQGNDIMFYSPGQEDFYKGNIFLHASDWSLNATDTRVEMIWQGRPQLILTRRDDAIVFQYDYEKKLMPPRCAVSLIQDLVGSMREYLVAMEVTGTMTVDLIAANRHTLDDLILAVDSITQSV